MTSFDAVANIYDRGRPGYPEELYDVLEPLQGLLVLEGGAGTGMASRSLLRRGARVVAFDISSDMLEHAVERSPELSVVVADGATSPFRDECCDVLCFAQAWHWLDNQLRCTEAARVLRRGGRLAAWWSHARGDGQPWFDAYWDVIEAAIPGVHRSQRDTDWGQELRRSNLFVVADRITIPWTRRVSIAGWLDDERSKSYVANLEEADRAALLGDIERIALEGFPGGQMAIPYETWLWKAVKA